VTASLLPPARLATTDVPATGCGCGPVGHRVLQATFGHVEAASDQDVARATQVVLGLRAQGLVEATVGAEGGWPRPSMWMATLTAAGRQHIAEVLDVAAHHAGAGGCGGTWTADQRCADCGTIRPLTDALAAGRLLAMPPGPNRAQEVWASQFACPAHGRGRTATVRTSKVCALCGQGLLRLLRPAVTEEDLAAADQLRAERR
jgi:hypothetical protein